MIPGAAARSGCATYFHASGHSAIVVGRAILPAAAFFGGFFAPSTSHQSRSRRLKAGGSQDWLPHIA